MRAALAALAEVGGGFCVVRGGNVLARLALPLGGLMSLEEPSVIARELDPKLQVLRQVTLFDELDETSLDLLAAGAALRLHRKGDAIVRQGEFSQSLLVVVSGVVEAVLESPGGESVRMHEFRPGDYFGEMSLLSGGPRSATIRTRGIYLLRRRTSFSCRNIETEQLQLAREELSRPLGVSQSRAIRRPCGVWKEQPTGKPVAIVGVLIAEVFRAIACQTRSIDAAYVHSITRSRFIRHSP